MHYVLGHFALDAHTTWVDAPLRTCPVRVWRRKAFRTFSSLLPAPWQDRFCLDLSASLCFAALMRFMGDQPKLKNQNDVECIYEILQVCDGNEGPRSCWEGREQGEP